MQKPIQFLLVICATTLLFACSDDDNSPDTSLKFSDTDYADMNNWMYFGTDISREADIFVIYPTMAGVTEEDGMPYVDINSFAMRQRAA